MIYLFSSANSFNSILTIDKKSKGEGHADSIFEISEELNLDKIFIIEKNPSSFPQALKNGGPKLVYGLKLTVCQDSNDKTLESIETEHKLVFLTKSGKGYKENLMKLYSDAATRGNYNGLPRTDFSSIKKFWSDELVMMVPFYGNFLEKNLFTHSNCLVEFKGYDPIFCVEDHSLPFDKFMAGKIKEFCKDNGFNWIDAHSVRYKNKEDILAYQTYMVIQNKSSIECPNLENFASDEFCLKS